MRSGRVGALSAGSAGISPGRYQPCVQQTGKGGRECAKLGVEAKRIRRRTRHRAGAALCLEALEAAGETFGGSFRRFQEAMKRPDAGEQSGRGDRAGTRTTIACNFWKRIL